MALCQRLFLFHLISSLAVGHSCLAFNEIFIMNTSLIVNACQGVCDDTQIDEVLVHDCHRGCRLFDNLQQPITSRRAPLLTPEEIALAPCNHSCNQVYTTLSPNRNACIEGCRGVQREYSKVHKLSLRWLRETQRHMGFFETLLEITTMIMTPYARSIDASKFMEQVCDKNNKKRWKVKDLLPSDENSNSTVSLLTEDELKNASPQWVSQTAIALFGFFTLALMGFSCYVCIWARQDTSQGLAFNDFPAYAPTFEALMHKGKELRKYRASSSIYA